MRRRLPRRVYAPLRSRRQRGLWLSVLLAVAMLASLLLWFDRQLRPVLETLAEAEVRNAVTAAVNDAISAWIAENAVTYDEIITVETDEEGRVTALKSNMAGANLLRSRLLAAALAEVSDLSERDFSVPLGNLLGLDFLSGRGPGIRAAVLSAGAAGADYRNEFTTAGVNQTLHRVLLEISISVRIILPGRTLETTVVSPVCIAETVIVGQVPGTYLQLERG